ncbi:DUF1553 domain-containing protein [Tautonia plasticadhaerens]|uniref:Planctomycete cytochrome C n=1 Tax=Tautonia plasticadhaerens TaxID=2527974 RepID=A0A518HAC5_9BACT|nr:DUF1553 domain-containing protein [Tautonia plasticadhaerens]QDV37804.1 Planctomycete cytochrome C [Tautonia plasticadhaerens]
MPRLHPLIPAAIALILAPAGSGLGQSPDSPAVSFDRDIRPILSNNCVFCHGPDEAERQADLRLDLAESALADRGGYRVVEPGDPDASELIYRITTDDEIDLMPPPDSGKELTPEQVDLLRRWIEQGAEFRPHWSFVPPSRPDVPKVEDASWPLNPIDRFLLAGIEARGLSPSPEADRATLIRRLSLDLTGLPPSPGEVDAFLGDPRPDAVDLLVDRLLASPRFGERMAISWLDLVRYADTVGYHGDQVHHITPYRDYVVDAFNANMPFDRFTAEQLAGDLLPEPTVDRRVASGYNRLLQTTHEGGAQDEEYLAKYAADRVRNVSAVWLGATMGCAECHDHKYDPYSQRDFYSLAAFFADLEQQGAYPGPDRSPTVRAPEIDVLDAVDRLELAEVEASIAALEAGGEDAADLEARREAIKARARRTMVSVSAEPRTTRLLPRGDWMDDSGPVVQPAVPDFLPDLGVEDRRATRLDLAEWLTRPDHPMTSRVFVNRLWARFFGRGISRSLDDTGLQGRSPSHPELLDWLAVEFVDRGWDVKHVVRLIVTSRAYRQSSTPTPDLLRADPGNEWFARQGRFRLPAELIRDLALDASGLLVERLGGPAAKPYQPEGYYAFLNFPKRTYEADTDRDQYRRGLYMHWQRQFLHPMLRAFDAPSREECTAGRPTSNTPLGALTLLNDPTFVEAARALAARALDEGGDSDDDRLRWAWRAALSRSPTDREVDALHRLLDASRLDFDDDPASAEALLSTGLAPVPDHLERAELAAWTAACRAILNLHETITRL